MSLLSDKELHHWVNDISLAYFNKPFMHKVIFNNRLRTTGGRYIPVKKMIELNPRYLEEAGEAEFIGIIKHELCHYHLHIEGKGYKHQDKSFKELMRATNSPRYCSPLPSQQRYKYTYICESCDQTFKRQRKVDIKKYRCGKCKGKLFLL
ncbi:MULTISPECIES: SprT family protein [Clostridia]|uniref:SprT family protein n=1 Tax=Clostridia TaxID=186801 RepID=UPI000EA1713B|nr:MULTISPECIES: SprT family protein [Clostridia]NBJ71305.1 SprT family protein [Roseburia sp. 1XD42-34]RKI74826.1 SprT family protein [Clostridium sp. 1xD42-85]